MISSSSCSQPDPPKNIHNQLIQATQNLDLQHIKTLLNQGANINQIIYSGGDGWYGGDTSTPLSVAFSYDFKPEQQQKYIDVIQYLLGHGADHGFQVTRGNWSRQRQYSIFEYLQTKIISFSSEDLAIRFLTILSKYGVDINVYECHSSRKSSNTWHSCLLIKMMERAGLKSRIKELTSFYEEIDVEKIRDQILGKLAMVYNQENKYVEGDEQYIPADYHINKYRYPQPDDEQSEPPKPPTTTFLKNLITLIPNINKSTGSTSYHNEKQHEYEQQGGVYCGEQISSYFDHKLQLFLTPLHLAIMNDSVEIVELLIEKGGKLCKCVFSVCKGVYHLEWSEKLKDYFVKENISKLKKYEQKKRQAQERLLSAQKGTSANNYTGYASSEEQQDIPAIKQTLPYLKFEIFKAQRFSIENLPPLEKYVKMSITCLALAQKFNVDPKILELLKKCQAQQLQVKKNEGQTEYE